MNNLENLKSAGKQAMCTDPIKYPNSPIAGKNGTYNKFIINVITIINYMMI